jgi:hypothetical protein
VNATVERQPPAAVTGVGHEKMGSKATAEAASQRVLIVHSPFT